MERKQRGDEKGCTILDVRDHSQFNRIHIKLCSLVPLFIENNDNDPETIVKRTLQNNFGGLFFGRYGGRSFGKSCPVFAGLQFF
ncbi:hypothetical protein KSP40_PGU018697 [Platanthera guangdongensis]|uniref:Uncharacterized protein n=1 Tax=Platanthera guangdongensis TaxID=2320717 RepID=A0ABR2MWB7_9ASPA